METSDCTAALNPSVFSSRGADELRRFTDGVRSRNETGVVIAVVGSEASPFMEPLIRAMTGRDQAMFLPESAGTINAIRVPLGTHTHLADGLDNAEKDLGLRLRGLPADTTWWSLSLGGLVTDGGGVEGRTAHPGQGKLKPILLDGLGKPIVAAWVSPNGDQRWFFVPYGVEPGTLLDWLVHQALPTYAPDAMRRVRARTFVDPDLQSDAEAVARKALSDMEMRHAEEKLSAEEELRVASQVADPIRHGLLFGTGAELVTAVAAVLDAAGLSVVDLDRELGGTSSADLFVSDDGGRLVEVKSAGGFAGERLVDDLRRHLSTWPQIRPQQPVCGGVLVVNHQHRLPPHERIEQVYNRAEFLATLDLSVVSTRALFNLWRTSDWAGVRRTVLGTTQCLADSPSAETHAAAEPASQAFKEAPRRRWRLGR